MLVSTDVTVTIPFDGQIKVEVVLFKDTVGVAEGKEEKFPVVKGPIVVEFRDGIGVAEGTSESSVGVGSGID